MPAPRTSGPRKAGPHKKRHNPLREAGVEHVDYKDTDLLRKFLTDKGRIRARRVTGLTPQQQRQVTRAIKNAREVALLPFSGRR